MQVIKTQMEALGKTPLCKFAFDGAEALKTAISVLEEGLTTDPGEGEIQPIGLMLLDF